MTGGFSPPHASDPTLNWSAAEILCKPYKLACVMAFWTLLSIGMAMPNVVVAATAQVSMGIANALMNRAVSEICLFFCFSDLKKEKDILISHVF